LARPVARGEADLAAGRVKTINIDALCQEREDEAVECERRAERRQVLPV